jgi:DNA-directed RNA polymerase specialized sigma24 family protein
MSLTFNRSGAMKNNDRNVQLADLLDAIQDQSRILIAFQEEFANTSQAATRLADLGIPPSRVATLLGKPLSRVTSALAKARKRSGRAADGMDDGTADDLRGDLDEAR